MPSVSVIILEYVCPALGCLMANIMFSAPYKSVKDAVKRGHLGDLNPTPWAFMTGNTVGWIAYSILLQNYYIFFANIPGFLLSIWFNLCAVKLQHYDHCAAEMRQSFVGFLETGTKKRVDVSSNEERQLEVDDDDNREQTAPWQTTATDLGALVLQVTTQQTPAPAPHEKVVVGMVFIWTVILSIICLTTTVWDARTRELIVGVAVNINLFFFYGAPLSTIVTVVRDRNAASIHIRTMVTNTLNGVFWTAYGVTIFDPFVYVPNGIGALLGVVQILLIVVFPRVDLRRDDRIDGTAVPPVRLDAACSSDEGGNTVSVPEGNPDV